MIEEIKQTTAEIKSYDYSYVARYLNENTRFDGTNLSKQKDTLVKSVEYLLEQNKALVEALEYYADKEKYMSNAKEGYASEAEKDCGNRARLTLTTYKEENTHRTRLIRLEKTCNTNPSQWEGETVDGKAFYAKYRGGWLTVTVDGEEVYLKQHEDHGYMETDTMLKLTGFENHI